MGPYGSLLCRPRYVAPAAFPSDTIKKIDLQYIPTSSGTYNVVFTFSNPNSLNLSLGVNPVQGTDPGPDPDTNGTTWTFKDVQPDTTQYINAKAMVNGAWTQGVQWTAQIPSWVAPTDTPTPTIVNTPGSNIGGDSSLLGAFIIAVLVISAVILSLSYFNNHYSVKKKSKS